MKHWSVDETELKKDPDAHAIWKLEQAINFGIRDGKVSRADYARYKDRLDLDPAKARFMQLIAE